MPFYPHVSARRRSCIDDEQLDRRGRKPKISLYVSFDNPIVKLVNVETVLSIYESLYPIEEQGISSSMKFNIRALGTRMKSSTTAGRTYGLQRPARPARYWKKARPTADGRWSILKIPTMSFYEYCRLLQIEEPILLTICYHKARKMSKAELGDLMDRFAPLEVIFQPLPYDRGLPELVLSDDDMYAQRMLRKMW